LCPTTNLGFPLPFLVLNGPSPTIVATATLNQTRTQVGCTYTYRLTHHPE
jgi:hypothetical protein